MAKKWLVSIGEIPSKSATTVSIQNALRSRGLLWYDRERGTHNALAAGVVFLGKNPSAPFPHCRILADAYRGSQPDPKPSDQLTISAPAPQAVRAVLDFVNKNTRHPPRVVGLNRVVLDEYPEEAVREAIVNAIAHRDYEDRSRTILTEIFFDRIVISSPGAPPKPLTLSKLRRGKYRPCSRNPVIAQCLASLQLMEQRGSGLGRMKAAMLDHGLDAPELDIADGYFQLTLPGPGKDLERLRVSPGKAVSLVPPSIQSEINERQKQIISYVLENGEVKSGWCRKKFKVAYQTVYRDINKLVDLGILETVGQGRSTRYVLKQK